LQIIVYALHDDANDIVLPAAVLSMLVPVSLHEWQQSHPVLPAVALVSHNRIKSTVEK
jgi:hypothetical protein